MKTEDPLNIEIEKTIAVPLPESTIVLNPATRVWCRLPYPNHPHGCPNYGKRDSCPPKAPLFQNVVRPPFFLVGVRFNLEQFVEDMRERHPDWTYRQLSCLLYWQRRVDKRLRSKGYLDKETQKLLHT